MKTIKIKLLTLLLMMGARSTIVFAQNIVVPQKVQSAFSIKFPQAQLKTWKIENGQYVASFVMDNKDGEATYANDGSWVSTLIVYNHVYKHLTAVMRDELRNSLYTSYHVGQLKSLQMPNMVMLMLALDNDNSNISAYENEGFVDMTTVYFDHSGKQIK
jgi:hypothetical protein